MLKAFRSHLWPLLGLGQDEGTLDDGLDIEREALRAPRGTRGVAAPGFGDVFGHHRRVFAEVRVARYADGRVRVVDLLDHRAEQAGVVRQRTLQDRDAEIHVAQQPVQRVGGALVRRRRKHRVSHGREMRRCGKRQVFLALEVMEEAAFGEFGGLTNVFDARCRVALGADDVERGVEEPHLGFVL